ncbi:hypothetical protein Aph01nite_23470 [Acrocarpospora phusangensis]|uniref:Uncharacterized protein n=1 Tax=Acrocarpospora phusangensis TaxID=1070424 RepID=A0A919Q821_9ACTN|nr:DUF5691 domain-containing protein [Acrocarpospora phusangensis]GIH24037.1 hypothetical protein Aph01nite_23470 [Acrocarpospora phusangensis]
MNGHTIGGAGWEQLVSAALMGSDRGAGASAAGVLEQAAVAVVGQRAGQTPVKAQPVAAAPAEVLPLAPSKAADRLARMLAGEHPRLIEEWLGLAVEHGVRVPARLIPQLLDLGARDRSIRGHLGVLAGARGRWLAELNPAWSYVLQESSGASLLGQRALAQTASGQASSGQGALSQGDSGQGASDQGVLGRRDLGEGTTDPGVHDHRLHGILDHGVWEFGSSGDRREFLERLRAVSPGDARELLAVGWEKEPPAERAAFLATFADGLSMADEPFLEAALDDRRREVRRAAADLLTRLPGSRLGRRMAERAARSLIRAGDTLTVDLPDQCDSAMERDGIRSELPAGRSGGRKSWWLQQLVAHTPLDFWTRHFGLPPEEITRLKIADFGREILMGWTRAAILQHDAAWARALFDQEPLTDLLAVLPAEEQSERAAELVRAKSVNGQLIMMLGGVAGPWSGPLAAAVLERVVEVAASQPWNAGELAKLAAERLDPAMHDQLGHLPENLHVLPSTLRFRFDLTKEFS